MPDHEVTALLERVGNPIATVRCTKTTMKVTMETKEHAAAALALSGQHHGIQILYDKHHGGKKGGSGKPGGTTMGDRRGAGGSAGGADRSGADGRGAADKHGKLDTGHSGDKRRGGARSPTPPVDSAVSDMDRQLYLQFVLLS
eukprot:TRINITY_DN26915_c0_g1_i1.p2 TRINITY_DN26915_c0_g1~~TRINITY_DN26915_c0_g1_i1.p2  ORF type:complete len:143 (+),score=2.18 TRINITY_DN26915_c0_g1_i1:409-837(+)